MMSDNELKNKSIEDLEHILKALEAQSRFTEMQIKEIKEELECRKHEIPLGVPVSLEDAMLAHVGDVYKYAFTSEESRLMFSARLNHFVNAIQKLAKGEPIDIEALLPLMNKGWVAMDKDGEWFWYNKKPDQGSEEWEAENFINSNLRAFNIKQVENWKDSLKESGL